MILFLVFRSFCFQCVFWILRYPFSLFSSKRSNGGAAVEVDDKGGGHETCVFAYSRHTLLLTRGSLRKSEQAVEERLSVSSLLLGLRGILIPILSEAVKPGGFLVVFFYIHLHGIFIFALALRDLEHAILKICTGLMQVGYGMIHYGETSLSHMGGGGPRWHHAWSEIVAPVSVLPSDSPRGSLPSTRLFVAIPVIHRVCTFTPLECCYIVSLLPFFFHKLDPTIPIPYSPTVHHLSPETDNAMSSSIAIPKRKQPVSSGSPGFASASSSSASPYPSWANSAASPSFSPSSLASSSASPSSACTPSSMVRYAERRPSLLGMFGVALLMSCRH